MASDIRPPRKGRQVPGTTDSRHNLGIAPNLLRRNFRASEPDRIWLADISVANGCSNQWRNLCDCLRTRAGFASPQSRSSSSCRHWSETDGERHDGDRRPLSAIARNRLPGSGSMSERLKSSLAGEAMRMALPNRRPAPGLICHSDRGVQYAAGDYRRLLDAWKAVASMSRKGNCLDNS